MKRIPKETCAFCKSGSFPSAMGGNFSQKNVQRTFGWCMRKRRKTNSTNTCDYFSYDKKYMEKGFI